MNFFFRGDDDDDDVDYVNKIVKNQRMSIKYDFDNNNNN